MGAGLGGDEWAEGRSARGWDREPEIDAISWLGDDLSYHEITRL